MLEIKLNGRKNDASYFFLDELHLSKAELIKIVSSKEFTDMPYHEKWNTIISNRFINLHVLIFGIKATNKELKLITDEYYQYKKHNEL